MAALGHGRRRAGARGFTLIELLVVVAVVAILAAIAIPQYALYRRRGIDAEMTSALNAGRTAMEAFYESNAYSYTGATVADLEEKGYRAGQNSTLVIVDANSTDYTLRACADGGTTPSFTFRTAVGRDEATTDSCS